MMIQKETIATQIRMETIIRNILSLQNSLGINQTELALRAGISRESLYRYGKLEWFISLENLSACASVLGVHIVRILLTREEILNELTSLQHEFPLTQNMNGTTYVPYDCAVYRKILADNVFHMRHKASITLKKLAEGTGNLVTHMSFSRYENGMFPMNPKVVIPTAKFFGETVIRFTSRKEDIPLIMSSLMRQ